MDRGDVPLPGSLNARYDDVSGGEGQRRAYYMARRHLGMSPAEWDALAWWEQKMYLDGYTWEGLIERTDSAEDPTVVAAQVHQEGSTTVTDRQHAATFSGAPGEMAAFGIPEQRLG